MSPKTEPSSTQASRTKAIIYLIILITLLSFIPVLISLNREIGVIGSSNLEQRAEEFKKARGIAGETSGPNKPGKDRVTLPPGTRLLDFVPLTIEGYLTGARHPLPGTKNVAEAFFQPDTTQAKSISPYNCYVRITYQPSALRARETIELSLKRYPVDQKEIKLGDLTATEGYEKEKMAYFIGWTAGNYAIEIDTGFIRAKHPGYTNYLVDSGREVAKAVIKQIKTTR